MPHTAPRPRLLALLAALALLLVACGGDQPADADAEAADADAADAGGGSEAAPAAATGDDLLAAAQEEGAVNLSGGGHTRDQVELLASAFEEEYGIPVTYNREESGAIVQQVEAQLSAGALQTDVVSLNDALTFERWAEQGVTTDPELPNRDQVLEALSTGDAPHVPFTLLALGVSYNGARITDPPQTWSDLAATDAVFAHADPGASGAAFTFVGILTDLLGEEFYEQLGEHQVLTTDSALAMTQLVATGEVDYALPGVESEVFNAQRAGEPLEIVYPEEGIPSLAGLIAPLAEAPHPNAAKLLVQYQLSEEFQTRMAQEIGSRSVLQGVPAPEGMPDLSDANLVTAPEDLGERREELTAMFSELVAP